MFNPQIGRSLDGILGYQNPMSVSTMRIGILETMNRVVVQHNGKLAALCGAEVKQGLRLCRVGFPSIIFRRVNAFPLV